MNMKDKDLLMELLVEIKYWNNTDIECFDDTTPNMEMLEARRDVIEKVLKLVKKIK